MALPPRAVHVKASSLVFNPSRETRPPHWFAVFTYPRHEKKVAAGLISRGVEAFLPLYNEQRTWKNRQRVSLSVPLFPNYVFARFARDQRNKVLSLPGVVNIVEGLRAGGAIPDQYIRSLQIGLELGRIRPYRDAIVGDRVRIASGPLRGVEGILMHFRSGFRVVLALDSIGQNASIEVLRDEVEPVTGAAAEWMA